MADKKRATKHDDIAKQRRRGFSKQFIRLVDWWTYSSSLGRDIMRLKIVVLRRFKALYKDYSYAIFFMYSPKCNKE